MCCQPGQILGNFVTLNRSVTRARRKRTGGIYIDFFLIPAAVVLFDLDHRDRLAELYSGSSPIASHQPRRKGPLALEPQTLRPPGINLSRLLVSPLQSGFPDRPPAALVDDWPGLPCLSCGHIATEIQSYLCCYPGTNRG